MANKSKKASKCKLRLHELTKFYYTFIVSLEKEEGLEEDDDSTGLLYEITVRLFAF